MVTLDLLVTLGECQVIPVGLVGHMITQSFENSQKSVFCHTSVIDIGIKE
jgi:hypothetical protein